MRSVILPKIAQVHAVMMQATMAAQLNELKEIAIMSVLVQLGRLAWRSSFLYRQTLFEKILRILDPKRTNTKAKEVERLVRRDKFKFLFAIEVQVEMLLENAAIGITIFMQWVLSEIKTFNTFVPPEMSFSLVFQAIGIQWAFQIVADLLFLLLNAKRQGRFPFQYVFKEMMTQKIRVFGFIGNSLSSCFFKRLMCLVFAMISMGLSAHFYFMLKLPRAGLCGTPDPCSCTFDLNTALCVNPPSSSTS